MTPEQAKQAAEEIGALVRANCPACNNGVAGVDKRGDAEECEYCGRLLQAMLWGENAIASLIMRHAGWQPIKSPPKGEVLLYFPREPKMSLSDMYRIGRPGDIPREPTHWLPLPPPPERGQG